MTKKESQSLNQLKKLELEKSGREESLNRNLQCYLSLCVSMNIKINYFKSNSKKICPNHFEKIFIL